MIKIRRIPYSNADMVGYEAVENGRVVGKITVRAPSMDDDGVPSVGWIGVERKRERLGTQLYLVAARAACRIWKKPLHSDFERSAQAQAFWEKQERKGRAICRRRMRTRALAVRDDGPALGRGGCWRYALTCPAPKSLDGLHRPAPLRHRDG